MRRNHRTTSMFLMSPFAFFALLPTPVAQSAAPRTVEYLYIEANEGSSAGGHVAIQFAERTYHFQHASPGHILLFREDSRRFRHRYGALENRTIHVSRIEVSEETYSVLLDRFNRYYLLQNRQFDLLEATREDRALLSALLKRLREGRGAPSAGGRAAIRLKGVGFFLEDHAGTGAGERAGRADSSPGASPALVALRNQVTRTYGGDFLRRRIAESRDVLLRLTPGESEVVASALSDRIPPVASYPFARRYTDRMIGLHALEVLRGAPSLRAGSYFAPDDREFRLDEEELLRLRAYARTLLADLVALLGSTRPDWGYPLLVGMARLAVLEKTLETGRLAFLDAYPREASVIPARTLEERRDVARELLEEARAEFRGARSALVDRDVTGEEDYAALETAANRYLELRSGIVEGRDVRVRAGRLIPMKNAMRSDFISPALGEADLEQALAQARERERELAARLRSLYGYNLFTKNCVSEIFRNIDVAFEGFSHDAGVATGSEGGVRAESTKRLGGYVRPTGSLAFIPFVSARAVKDAYRVSKLIEIPSYREARLSEMYARENPISVYLRESNTLTSTIYARNRDDSFFLFFTDDAVLPRPILGAFNLAAGLAEGVWGLIQLPRDGGRTLWSGLKGALVSLPELAFVNIRKGTQTWVAPEAQAPSTGGAPELGR